MPTPLLDNRQLGTDVQRPNLLTNGGFRVSQRGTSFTNPTSGTLTLDGWRVFFNTGGFSSVGQGLAYTPNPNANVAGVSGTLTYTSGQSNFYQRIALSDGNMYNLRGKAITLAAWLAAQQANACALWLQTDGTGGLQVLSATQAGDNTWRRVSVTGTVPNDAAWINAGLWFTANCSWGMTEATLVQGSQAMDYVPLSPAEDLARCQRYYELIGTAGVGDIVVGGAANAAGPRAFYNGQYRAQKAVTPTVTKNGTWGASNATQITGASSITALGFWASVSASAAGEYYNQNTGTGSCFTAEANP